MRLFFAIMLSEDVREVLRGVQATLQDAIGSEGVRWEKPEKFHITVRFLGDVALEKLEDVKQAGREAAGGCAPFTLGVGDIGTFPERRPARVLWIGMESLLPEYVPLAEYLERELSARGFEHDRDRPFRSIRRQTIQHVTLARVKTPFGSQSIARALAAKVANKVDKEAVLSVCSMVLCDSELRPEGSVYTVLETFPLSAI